MPDFPLIGCGGVARYPSSVELQSTVRVQRYVDGSEQRVRAHVGMRREWVLRMEQLSERDAAAVLDFMTSMQGRRAAFRFQDPWTGDWYEPCWFASDRLELEHRAQRGMRGELRIQTMES